MSNHLFKTAALVVGVFITTQGIYPKMACAFEKSEVSSDVTLSENLLFDEPEFNQPRKTIRVGTKQLHPFVFLHHSGSPYGYSVDLWQSIAQDLNVDTEWVVYDSVSEVLGAVRQDQVDVAIAGISITSAREAQGLDFSYPFYQSGLQLMVLNQDRSFIGRLSSWFTWSHLQPIALVLLSSSLFGGLIWWVERGQNSHFSDNFITGVGQGIWFAIVTLGTFGYGDVTPRKPVGRILTVIWMGISFFIVADFIAGLTVHQLSDSRLDLAALAGRPVGVIAGTTGEIFLQSWPVEPVIYPEFEAAVAALESGEIAGLLQDEPTLKHFTQLNVEKFELAGARLTTEGYGVVVQEGEDALLEAIDRHILDYQQRNYLQQIHQKWFEEPSANE